MGEYVSINSVQNCKTFIRKNNVHPKTQFYKVVVILLKKKTFSEKKKGSFFLPVYH